MGDETPPFPNPSHNLPLFENLTHEAERNQHHILDLVRSKLSQETRTCLTRFLDDHIIEYGTQSLRKGIVYKKYIDGSEFKGQVKNGKKNGVGVYYYYTGDKFCGNWVNDEPNGEGLLLYENMERYEGIIHR